MYKHRQASDFTNKCVDPLKCKGNYSATSNNMKFVHWPLMGGLLHLVQRGGAWAGCLVAVPSVTAHPSTDGQKCNVTPEVHTVRNERSIDIVAFNVLLDTL